MNKAKYFLGNGDKIVGIVYESDKYGRTLVVLDKLDPNYLLEIHEPNGGAKKITDTDLLEFLYSMIPVENNKTI